MKGKIVQRTEANVNVTLLLTHTTALLGGGGEPKEHILTNL